MIGDQEAAAGSREGQSAWKRWYLVFVMFFIAVSGQVDRQVMAMVAPQMKADLHFTDEQIGILLGFGFSVTYAVCAIFMAYLGDRFSRKNVLMIGLIVWSSLTGLCAFAANFALMLAARLGVGVGESVLTPTAYPMVSSAFPAEKRSLPIALVVAGSPVGLIVAPILVGSIVHATHGQRFALGTWFPSIHGWQLAFIVCGGLGLVALGLLLLLRQPKASADRRAAAATVPEAIGYFLRHKRYFGGLFYEAEARYLVAHEWAQTPEDILFRRTKHYLHLDAAERAAFTAWFNEAHLADARHLDRRIGAQVRERKQFVDERGTVRRPYA